MDCLPCWSDINPRLGAAYDLFGNGKTAVKFNIGRYVGGEAVDIASANHPVNASVNAANRTWGDTNRNYVPDCDLRNPLQNGECGDLDNQNFGRNNPNAYRYDAELLKGWNKRNYTWQAQAFVQHELMQNVGVTFGYFRTWYGNFRVTANQALTPADFDSYCITAPSDSRFADQQRQPDLRPVRREAGDVRESQQVVEHASNYGDYNEVYNGFDVLLNARLQELYVTGGLNTGRTEIELLRRRRPAIRRWFRSVATTASTGVVAFTQPQEPHVLQPGHAVGRADAGQDGGGLHAALRRPGERLVSVLPGRDAVREHPGEQRADRPVVSSRNLSAGATATVVIDVVPQHFQWEDPTHQTDFRFIKAFRLGERAPAAGRLRHLQCLQRPAGARRRDALQRRDRRRLAAPDEHARRTAVQVRRAVRFLTLRSLGAQDLRS